MSVGVRLRQLDDRVNHALERPRWKRVSIAFAVLCVAAVIVAKIASGQNPVVAVVGTAIILGFVVVGRRAGRRIRQRKEESRPST